MPQPDRQKKVFVLDTSVILYDFNALQNFQEHDVAIPITVLEELDQFKKGNSVLNLQAREFIRQLDKLSGRNMLGDWIPLDGPARGKLPGPHRGGRRRVDAGEVFGAAQGRPPHPERRPRPHPRRARAPRHPGQQGHQPAPQGAGPEPAGRGLRDASRSRTSTTSTRARPRSRWPTRSSSTASTARSGCRVAELLPETSRSPTTTSSCAADGSRRWPTTTRAPTGSSASSRPAPTASRRATPSRPSPSTRC